MLLEEPISLLIRNHSRVTSEWALDTFTAPNPRIYLISGGAAELINSGKRTRLVPGHMYLLPAHLTMKRECPDFLDHYWIHFELNNTSGGLNDFIRSGFYSIDVSEQMGRYIEYFEMLIGKDGAKEESLIRDQGIFRMLLAPFLQFYKKGPLIDDRVQKALSFIDENMVQNFHIDDLSRHCHLERTYFSALFKRETGESPRQYVINKRLELAQKILWHSDRKVKEVALLCGFEDEPYFSRLFRKKTGLTPTGYRDLRDRN